MVKVFDEKAKSERKSPKSGRKGATSAKKSKIRVEKRKSGQTWPQIGTTTPMSYVRTVDPCEGLVRLSVHHGVWRAHDEGGELLGGRVYVQTRLVGARRRHYLKLRIYLILGIGPLTLLKLLQ